MDDIFASFLPAPRITIATLHHMVEDLSSDAFDSLLALPTSSVQAARVPQCPQASRETITSESEWDLQMLIEELSEIVSPLVPQRTSSCVHEAVMMARPQNPQARGMRKSESELALQKLVEELSESTCSCTASPPSVPQSSNNHGVGEIEQHPESTLVTRRNSDALVSGTPWSLAPQSPTWSVGNDQAFEMDRSQPKPLPCPSFDTSVLQAQLYMACAAAAARFGESSTQIDEDETPATTQSQMGSPGQGPGDGLSIRTEEVDATVKREKKPGNQTITKCSSTDDLDIIKHKDQDHTRRAKRLKGKNRESATSYRRKKPDEIMELEAKIDKLMDERSTILSQFADIQKRHHGAVCDNRNLMTEIETLKEKVNKSEKIVEELVRWNPMLLSRQSTTKDMFNPTAVPNPTSVGVAMEPSFSQSSRNASLLGSPCVSSFLSRPVLPRNTHPVDARTYVNSDRQVLVGLFNPSPVFSANVPL